MAAIAYSLSAGTRGMSQTRSSTHSGDGSRTAVDISQLRNFGSIETRNDPASLKVS
jgi:hypothetical protein